MSKIRNRISSLSRGPKIVVIGGGTGLSVLLRGLKKHTSNLTAIVTVADDGGSSGVLREDLGMLPPGDIRACLLALANTEPSMEKLFNYRFKEGSLENQSMGNLLIAAMNDIYGSFDVAIRETSNVLAVTGQVLPMTLSNVQLCALLENGEIIKGESKISGGTIEWDSKIDRVYMEPKVSHPLEESVKAINDADLIVLGPGSLYTSVVPNLLVNDIVTKLYNAKAPIVYVGNIMTEPGETDGLDLYGHVEALLKHSRDDFLDYVIGNIQYIPDEKLEKYLADGADPVFATKEDKFKLDEKNIKLICSDLIEINNGYIRHNNEKLSEIIVGLAMDLAETKRFNKNL